MEMYSTTVILRILTSADLGNDSIHINSVWTLPNPPLWGRPIMYQVQFANGTAYVLSSNFLAVPMFGLYESWVTYMGVRTLPQAIEVLNIHYGAIGFDWNFASPNNHMRGMAALPVFDSITVCMHNTLIRSVYLCCAVNSLSLLLINCDAIFFSCHYHWIC